MPKWQVKILLGCECTCDPAVRALLLLGDSCGSVLSVFQSC